LPSIAVVVQRDIDLAVLGNADQIGSGTRIEMAGCQQGTDGVQVEWLIRWRRNGQHSPILKLFNDKLASLRSPRLPSLPERRRLANHEQVRTSTHN